MKLFEIIGLEKPKPTTQCRNCEHSERHQCCSKVFWYCGIRKSNRTSNGLLKIKAGLPSCESFKTIT